MFETSDSVEISQETAEQSLLWIGDHVPGGFFIYRAHGDQEVLYVNRSTLKIYGCETIEQFQALTGGTFPGMVHKDDLDSIQASIDQQIADSGSDNLDYVEYRIIRRDGTVRWVDDYGHFTQMPGYGDVYYVFISDVTDKRQAQAARVRMEVELAHEKQLNELKSEFLFNVSHDIRTPLNAIIGFSELSMRHMDEPELLKSYLDKTVSSSHQLLAMIDDLLEMSNLENGRIQLDEEQTDLRAQIDMTMDLFRLDAQKKHITLKEKIDLPNDPVLIDQSRFRRVLSNLISNAIKFTPTGGTVSVTARRRHVSTSGFARYEIQVKDTGIGISDAYIDRIFKPFERVATSTKTGETGTGLGLAIVRSLLNLMGGSISCTSQKDKGSIFTIGLPLRLSEITPVPQTKVSPVSVNCGQGRRILIVEDIELNRELAETLLVESGFQVESVPDGCDAVEAVRNHPLWYYDLILMDIQMPVMNGYEATRAIRALPRDDAARIPILALSANSREEDRRMSIESGMNCHVAKPFDIDPLILTINEYIASADRSASHFS